MTAEQKLLTELLESSTAEVVAHFTSFKGALVDTLEAPKWCYVPGERKDRLLLVAHADTVNNDATITVEWIGGMARLAAGERGGKQRALGGDDRTGCAALLWLLQEHGAFGHSVLITTGEENGCVGARDAVRVIGAEHLAKHCFAIEMDRRGARNYVFYHRTATHGFAKHVKEMLPGFEEQNGSFSDIGTICPEVGICGVNIAAGYFGEHSEGEMVILDAWLDSLNALRSWVAQPKHKAFPTALPEPVTALPSIHHGSAGRASERLTRTADGKCLHSFRYRTTCVALVCDYCQEHWYTRTLHRPREERASGSDCPVCNKRVEERVARLIEVVHQAEVLVRTSKGVLSVSHRNALQYAHESGALSKKMRKRINKLLLNDKMARQPLFPTAPTAGNAGPLGACLVCGYQFKVQSLAEAKWCPMCHHNPNFAPEAEPALDKAVAAHQCSECKQHVRRDVDHSFSCSSYPGSTGSNRLKAAM